MDIEADCLNYRERYDALSGGLLEESAAEPLRRHVRGCQSCRTWAAETDEMISMSVSLPMFDVPEQLTQRVLQSIEAERKLPLLGQYNLLVPVAVVGIASVVAVFPMDTLEGFLSTAIGLGGLFLVKLLITGVKSEELLS